MGYTIFSETSKLNGDFEFLNVADDSRFEVGNLGKPLANNIGHGDVCGCFTIDNQK